MSYVSQLTPPLKFYVLFSACPPYGGRYACTQVHGQGKAWGLGPQPSFQPRRGMASRPHRGRAFRPCMAQASPLFGGQPVTKEKKLET